MGWILNFILKETSNSKEKDTLGWSLKNLNPYFKQNSK